jgi:hypothetical protein
VSGTRELQPASSDGSNLAQDAAYFALASDFWKYIVGVIPLTVCTLGITLWLEWKWVRKAARRKSSPTSTGKSPV